MRLGVASLERIPKHMKIGFVFMWLGSHSRDKVGWLTVFLSQPLCRNVILTAPLWTAITRLKTQKWYASCTGAAMHATSAPGAKARKYSGLLRTMVYIARDEGKRRSYMGSRSNILVRWFPNVVDRILRHTEPMCTHWNTSPTLLTVISRTFRCIFSYFYFS